MIQMRRTWSAAVAGTAALMTSAISLADTTATVTPSDASNASVANVNQPSLAKKVLNRLSVGVYSTYYGTSLGKVADPYQPDEYGRTKELPEDDRSAAFFDTVLPVMYKINNNGLVAGFALAGAYSPVMGQGLTLNDPYVKVGHSKLIKSGNFTFGADLRSYLPTSKSSHDNNRLTRIRSNQTATYDIPNSKWSFNCINSYNYYVWGNNGSAKAKNIVIAVNPGVSYQAFEKLGFWGGYEFDINHKRNQNAVNWNNEGTWLYLGASWDVTKSFNFAPYLSIRPGGAINADSTQLTANIGYTLL